LVVFPICAVSLMGLAARADFVVDGVRDPILEPYTERSVQLIESNWTAANGLANLHTAVVDANLLVSLGGRASGGNAILLFIDCKTGGVPLDETGAFIPNNLITSGEESNTINNLGQSAENGMRFESGFRPDFAVRIYGDGNQAHVSRFDLAAGTRHYVGESVSATRSGGFVSRIRSSWQNVPANPAQATHGVEMSLNLPLMGVATGTSTVKLMAILVNGDSSYASNQVLGALNPPVAPPLGDIGAGIKGFNFETEPGNQTLTFEVTYSVTDSDSDGLADVYETNDGVFQSITATGTDPLNPDSDGDTFQDGAEVSGSALGFVSNPNIPNYPQIWAPGSFTTPQWTPGTGATAMTRLGVGMSTQYQWQRDYRITSVSQIGTAAFKFTGSGSTFAVEWGLGDTPGTIKRNGNNIPGKIPATGFYRIDFDQAALTYQFNRRVFPDASSFLAAYGLSAGSDSDADGIPNEEEWFANTDPSNLDSDNDGINDLLDPNPLAALRDISFAVDMSVQAALGAFDPAQDLVKVRFFYGVAAPGELLMTDQGGGIYSAILADAEGLDGQPFGGYKFLIEKPAPTPPLLESAVPDRTFNLGPAHQAQNLPVVFFNNLTGLGSEAYVAWAEQFTPNPGLPGEDADRDTFSNYEEFLFGTHPLEATSALKQVERVGGSLMVRWNERDDGTVAYDLLQSDDLSGESWDFGAAETDPALDQEGVPDGYTRLQAVIPIQQGRNFIRVRATEE
jgi:hypothetical protein